MNTFAQNRKERNPLNYPYYIYGEQQIKGKDSSILRNIKYNGFKSTTEKVLPDSVRNTAHKDIKPDLVKKLGEEVYEKFVYEFEAISTISNISLENKELQYWWKDEDGEWWSDIEAGNGTGNQRTDKETFFVLVLDCSKSLDEDFKEVQAGAWAFIEEMYKYCNPVKGNIKIGIVYFSSMKNTEFFPITELTESTKELMRTFVFDKHNDTKATAMYYAVNAGLDELSKYEKRHGKNVSSALYGGTYIITFTDGLDNTSQLEKQNLYTVSEVKKYVENKVHKTNMYNGSITSWVIGTQGGDVQDEQLKKMRDQLETLATPGHFMWMENMSECINTFKDIAKSCSKQWQNLSCTSSLSHAGEVCWTLGEVKEPIEPKVSKDVFLGANLGIGTDITVGVDFAYPLTSNIGLGGYLSLGGELIGEAFCAEVGLLATTGNHNDKRIKFLYGLGGHFGGTMGVDLRFGMIFRNGLYLFANPYIGKKRTDDSYNGSSYNYSNGYYNDSYNESTIGGGVTINIGYDLGKLFLK